MLKLNVLATGLVALVFSLQNSWSNDLVPDLENTQVLLSNPGSLGAPPSGDCSPPSPPPSLTLVPVTVNEGRNFQEIEETHQTEITDPMVIQVLEDSGYGTSQLNLHRTAKTLIVVHYGGREALARGSRGRMIEVTREIRYHQNRILSAIYELDREGYLDFAFTPEFYAIMDGNGGPIGFFTQSYVCRQRRPHNGQIVLDNVNNNLVNTPADLSQCVDGQIVRINQTYSYAINRETGVLSIEQQEAGISIVETSDGSTRTAFARNAEQLFQNLSLSLERPVEVALILEEHTCDEHTSMSSYSLSSRADEHCSLTTRSERQDYYQFFERYND